MGSTRGNGTRRVGAWFRPPLVPLGVIILILLLWAFSRRSAPQIDPSNFQEQVTHWQQTVAERDNLIRLKDQELEQERKKNRELLRLRSIYHEFREATNEISRLKQRLQEASVRQAQLTQPKEERLDLVAVVRLIESGRTNEAAELAGRFGMGIKHPELMRLLRLREIQRERGLAIDFE